MNAADRFVLWLLVHLIPRRAHYSFPIWLRRLLNRWMRHVGDPGDATDPDA